ncbi:MAG: phosphatase PAP2 family protein [Burkholderiales bacterium]|nr:phosphatase PAP2 family protein [Burkholderiales bacterium]
MNKKLAFNILVVSLILCGLSALSILFIDRDLALLVHNSGLDSNLWLRKLTEGLPVLLLVMLVIVALFTKLQSGKLSALLLSAYVYLGLKLMMEIKTGLKTIFGRYWTKTWINHNLSLIHDGIYGFNWWHGFGNQGSFPSGHSTYTAFCCLWLYLLLPRYKAVWLILLIIMPLGLIVLDYHYLGDCLAGVALGLSFAVLSASIWYKLELKIFVFR